MDIRQFDLNLLRVFSQIYRDRKVSLAAEHLGVSQPTVSAALGKLRRRLDDELFVRTARGMEPTPLAQQIAPQLERALASIHETLAVQLPFDPASAQREFTVAMTDIGEMHFLPRLVAVLESEAPGLSIRSVRGNAVDLKSEMEAGNIDVALGHLPDLVTDFHRRTLFAQRYVCLFREGHAMDGGRADLQTYARSEHVAVLAAGTGHGRAEELIEQSGIRHKVRLRLPHFVALADLLEDTDLVATVPEVFAQRSTKHFRLRYCAHPVSLPAIDIGLYWYKKFHRDPGNRWLRNLIVSKFQKSE